MKLPFTIDQFLAVFREYNIAVWPAQIFLNLIAAGMILLLFTRIKQKSWFINIALSGLWLWTGLVYHLNFFSKINPAAKLFGILFIAQALLFFVFGGMLRTINYSGIKKSPRHIAGLALVLYALILYPALGMVFGHTYPASPTFGLPCPTTIFTIGFLFFALPAVRWYLLIIPILWSFVGGSAAFKLGIVEDFGLLISGLLLLSQLFTQKK